MSSGLRSLETMVDLVGLYVSHIARCGCWNVYRIYFIVVAIIIVTYAPSI